LRFEYLVSRTFDVMKFGWSDTAHVSHELIKFSQNRSLAEKLWSLTTDLISESA
jgi:hypothetical protein